MTKKKITLEDGRYLIYFTFEKNDSGKEAKKSAAKCCDGRCRGGEK